MSSALRFRLPVQGAGVEADGDGSGIEWSHVYAALADANGSTGWSRQKNYVGFTHDTEFVMNLRNRGSGGRHLDVLKSTDASRVLAVTDTGLTTPLAITSTAATGTAPFSVASTTVVPNLNASLLQGFAAADFATPADIAALEADIAAVEADVAALEAAIAGLDATYVNVTGDTMTGGLTVQGAFAADSSVTLGNSITDATVVSGTLEVNDSLQVDNDLTVTDHITVNGNSSVFNGTVSFNEDVAFSDPVTFTDNPQVVGTDLNLSTAYIDFDLGSGAGFIEDSWSGHIQAKHDGAIIYIPYLDSDPTP